MSEKLKSIFQYNVKEITLFFQLKSVNVVFTVMPIFINSSVLVYNFIFNDKSTYYELIPFLNINLVKKSILKYIVLLKCQYLKASKFVMKENSSSYRILTDFLYKQLDEKGRFN